MRLSVGLATLLLALSLSAGRAEDGERLFALHCAACHGTDARGDGTVGHALGTDPADLTRLAARNSGVFPRAQAARKIDGRDPLTAHGGEMPVYGWFFEGPEVRLSTENGESVLTTAPIAAIILWLESVQQ